MKSIEINDKSSETMSKREKQTNKFHKIPSKSILDDIKRLCNMGVLCGAVADGEKCQANSVGEL